MRITNVLGWSALGVLFSSAAQAAGVAGIMSYGSTGATPTPDVVATVPTLTGSMLLVLGGLLAIVAFRLLRKSPALGRMSGVLALAGSVILAAFGGVNVVSDVVAENPRTLPDASGTVVLPFGGATWTNTSGGTLQILQISSAYPNNFVVDPAATVPQCKGGVVLANNTACHTFFTVP